MIDMVKYYYKTKRNKFDNSVCVEECKIKSPIKIGSENCTTKCDNFFTSGSDKMASKGWIKCAKLNEAVGKEIKKKKSCKFKLW
jgi:hypothetical protein